MRQASPITVLLLASFHLLYQQCIVANASENEPGHAEGFALATSSEQSTPSPTVPRKVRIVGPIFFPVIAESGDEGLQKPTGPKLNEQIDTVTTKQNSDPVSFQSPIANIPQHAM